MRLENLGFLIFAVSSHFLNIPFQQNNRQLWTILEIHAHFFRSHFYTFSHVSGHIIQPSKYLKSKDI